MINKTIDGKNNSLNIKSNKINNLNIDIVGDNNDIVIEEDVVVKGLLGLKIEGNNCKILINKNTTFEGSEIDLAEDNVNVLIGEDCMFARETLLLASDFHSIFDLKTGQRTNSAKNIILGNHTWIATRSIILKGTIVGNNSIIGAGSVVHGKFDNNSIISGNPAKQIRKNVVWARNLLPKVNIDNSILRCMKSSNSIKHFIEKRLSSENFELNGWAILEGCDSSKCDLFIHVKSKKKHKDFLYKAYKFDSVDVEEAFGNELYKKSRFKSIVCTPIDEIYSMDIVVVTNDEIYYKTIYKNDNYCD